MRPIHESKSRNGCDCCTLSLKVCYCAQMLNIQVGNEADPLANGGEHCIILLLLSAQAVIHYK